MFKYPIFIVEKETDSEGLTNSVGGEGTDVSRIAQGHHVL